MIKKALLLFGFLTFCGLTYAQRGSSSALKAGDFLIEANTGFGYSHTSDTALKFESSNGSSSFGFNAEAGYFVIDNLALKGGFGVGTNGNNTAFSYKFGAKYYIIGAIPIQVDLNGRSISGNNLIGIGFQGGYALFVAPNVSIEPGIRYDIPFKEGVKGKFQGNIGFAIHF